MGDSPFMKIMVPAAFIILAGYNLYLANWLEGALYVSVAVAFPLMWALRAGRIKRHRAFWNALSWLLIILALLLFLAVLQYDALSGR